MDSKHWYQHRNDGINAIVKMRVITIAMVHKLAFLMQWSPENFTHVINHLQPAFNTNHTMWNFVINVKEFWKASFRNKQASRVKVAVEINNLVLSYQRYCKLPIGLSNENYVLVFLDVQSESVCYSPGTNRDSSCCKFHPPK